MPNAKFGVDRTNNVFQSYDKLNFWKRKASPFFTVSRKKGTGN